MTVIPGYGGGPWPGGSGKPRGQAGGAGVIRTAYFYPVVMPMIAIASVWMFIYMAKNGLFDQLLIAIGLKPMNALSSKSTVLPAMAVMYVWKEAGYLMVFFLSGIQSISDEVMEAVGIWQWCHPTGPCSGASPCPCWRPPSCLCPRLPLPTALSWLRAVVIMTEGAPNNASTLLLYYIYQQGFTNFNYGVSSALTVIMLGLLLVVSLPRFISQDKKIHYN